VPNLKRDVHVTASIIKTPETRGRKMRKAQRPRSGHNIPRTLKSRQPPIILEKTPTEKYREGSELKKEQKTKKYNQKRSRMVNRPDFAVLRKLFVVKGVKGRILSNVSLMTVRILEQQGGSALKKAN